MNLIVNAKRPSPIIAKAIPMGFTFVSSASFSPSNGMATINTAATIKKMRVRAQVWQGAADLVR